ncbi:MAG: alanine racemase [Acidimicrobiia bacterium]
MRPSWVEVDLDAVRANVAAIRQRVAPSRVCAVVKADAYGHGDVPCAEAALAGGADWLAVALVEEGARLREAGITAPVFLLSEPVRDDVAGIVAWDLIPTGYRADFCEALAAEVTRRGADPYPIHLKVDTGMHRVGADPGDLPALVHQVVSDPRLRLDGLWTHFPVSESDQAYTRHQVADLLEIRDRLAADGIEIPMVHAANTAGALDLADARLDMVRVGLGIYGLRPDPATAPDLPLRPAMRVVSRVAFVRRLSAGERPSYGRRRPLPNDATIATVPIGYADGVARRLADVGGVVLIRGRRYPFAGTVTMDQIVIDVGDDEVEVGDEVVVLGAQGRDAVTAEEWADRLGTINYEIVCQFGPRLPRRYLGSPDA